MLRGKKALITGSTSGIGQAIATALAQQGCDVMLNGFGDASSIEANRQALEKKHSISALYHGADLTKPEQIDAMFTYAKAQWGRVDILVNNAGVQHVAPVEDFPVEKWNLILALNLSACFHTTRLVVPMMKEKGFGRIINIASAHALVASPYKSAYVAAKHGLAGFTKSVALEVAQEGITCNAICPGYVLTPLVENQIADTAKARGISEEEVKRDVMLKAQPTKQFVTAEQVAFLAQMLCADAANNITGSLLSVDGGWCAQ